LNAQRIYHPTAPSLNEVVALTPTASHHLINVLRKKPGEPLILFCGNNQEYTATITTIDKRQVWVTIHAIIPRSRESVRMIHLAQAVCKGDRLEWIIQKAVEIGVTHITPLITTRSVVKLDETRRLKKHAQWQAIAIGAAEQCGRNQLPIIHPTTPFETFLTTDSAAHRLILNPYGQKTWRDISTDPGEISLIIGPEGGLTDAEITQATAQRVQSLTLGPRILRTETAAIAALSVLQATTGDW
jgi:16S rRNA (uracil1498-N3)-methyltransferase